MTVFVDNYSGMKNVKCNLRGVYTRFHLGGNEILKNVLPTLQTKRINKIINDKHKKYIFIYFFIKDFYSFFVCFFNI